MSIKHLENLIANKHRNYTQDELSAFYGSRTWKKCRNNTLERDDFLCQFCIRDSIPTPANTVHHIVHLKEDPTLALEDSNLVSLCWDCHERKHNRSKGDSKYEEEVSSKINVFVIKNNPNKTF